MAFKDKSVRFTLKDVGSKIIDQLSTDVYTGPVSILRELVKNSYDALIALDMDEIDDDDFERKIVISRERDPKGVGRLIISDTGIGQNLHDLKANVQISISRKQDELENATGFRGLGSWAILGGGSRVIITSSKVGDPQQHRLTLDVRQIYKKLGPTTTLDDILNDNTCITFASDRGERDEHFTTVEIVCDGKASKVNGHELNRLYEFTNPDEVKLRDILIRACPIPFVDEGGIYKRIHSIYAETGYVPIPVFLEAERLERRLPSGLSEIKRHELKVGKSTAAVAWVVEDPKHSGELVKLVDEEQHLLGGAGLQLMKLNVPIGKKNIFGENVRATILNWYVGEIHILTPEVLPDAGGNDLRAGTARELFVDELRSFYTTLQEQAELKSVRVSLIRKMQQGLEAAKKLQDNGTPLTEAQKQTALAKVVSAVEAVEETGKTSKATSVAATRVRTASRETSVKEARKVVRKALNDAGYLTKYATRPAKTVRPKKTATSKNSAKNNGRPAGYIHGLTTEQFSAKVGGIIPKLKKMGLSAGQIEQVLDWIRELVT